MAVHGLGLVLGAVPLGFKGGDAVLWAYCLLAWARGTSGGAFEGSGGGGFTRLMWRSGEEGTGNQHLQTVQIGRAHQVMAQQSQLNKAVSHLHWFSPTSLADQARTQHKRTGEVAAIELYNTYSHSSPGPIGLARHGWAPFVVEPDLADAGPWQQFFLPPFILKFNLFIYICR